ncbi:uncharacterized protein LOC134215840 [Armigeres subalbatus]|uniref:uncharacterized protein LOC134215840 n=1 Tax=Armigeres subalbatus TaxID=124917 RepID=UPI002ED6A2F7
MCSFGDEVDSMVMDQIVYATQNDDKLRAKYLECDTTLDEMLKIGRTYETVNQQVHEIRFKSPDNIEVNAILNADNVHRTKKLSCVRCSGNHTSVDPLCPARGSRCNRCNKLGHYARCCRGAKKPFQRQPKSIEGRKQRSDQQNHGSYANPKPKFVREVDDVTKSVEIRELFHLNGKRTTIAAVGGVDLRLIIDTGADEDVLGIDDWTTLKRVGFEAYDIRKGSDKIFQAYGSNKPLIVLGEVDAMIAVGEQSCRTTFFVIQDGNIHSSLDKRRNVWEW